MGQMTTSDSTPTQTPSPKPAGPGKVISAGPGKTVPAGRGTGHWRTYDGVDGLANVWAESVFQDQEGYIWVGTESGVSRYDGRNWTTFTTKDGLADNHTVIRGFSVMIRVECGSHAPAFPGKAVLCRTSHPS